MRNIPIDTSRFTFVCVQEPRPAVKNKQTGELKVDRDGNAIFEVGISAADSVTGRLDLLTVKLVGDSDVMVGQLVTPVGLVASPWEQRRNGELYWGVSFRADQIVPAVPSVKAA